MGLIAPTESPEYTSEVQTIIEQDILPDIPVTVHQEELTQVVEELKALLPEVTNHLHEHSRLSEWVAFFKLVSEGGFSVDHIACQLFLDVIKFHQNSSIYGMRFTKEVRQFWTVGLQLFHARFIRFMGGFKCVGQLVNNRHFTRENLTPELSQINFICPDIKQLRDEKKKLEVKCDEPGIIYSNLDAMCAVSNKRKT